MPRRALFDWKTMTGAIAAQKPLWPPGTTPCYHTATQGLILGEIVRRVAGRRIGANFREEVAGPLELDYHIGLLPAEESRCATMVPSAGNVLSAARAGGASDLLARGWAQLPLQEDFNSHCWRAGEVPSANGHGTARSIARLYALLAVDGAVDDAHLLRPETIERAWQEQWHGRDLMSGLTLRTALGFYLDCPPDRPMGTSRRAFGHFGAGGAQSFGDPDNQIAFCYAPNRMHSGFDIGPRTKRLIDAVMLACDRAAPAASIACQIRCDHPHLLIVLTTGYAERARGRGGGLPVLLKPYAVDELASVLSRVLGQAAA